MPFWPTVAGSSLLLITATWSLKSRMPGNLWAASFTGGVFLAALLNLQQTRRIPVIWEILPPREAELTIKVNRLYPKLEENEASGIGKIVETADHLPNLRNHAVYFSTETAEESIARGQILQLKGVLSYLPAKDSRSLFEEYLSDQSISLTLTRADIQAPPVNGNPLEQLVGRLRAKAIRVLGTGIEKYQEPLSIYRGMMLGLKGGLSTENKKLFLQTGTLHLFAISGLHVGIIAVTLAGIFTVLRIPKIPSAIVGLILVYLYVEMTGASPSAVRAFAMTAFFWLGTSLVRQMPPFQALVASAVVVLLLSPNQLFSAGFQLSYTVVAGILTWGLPLYQTLRDRHQARILEKQQHQTFGLKLYHKGWEAIVGTLCVSLSATLASAPLSILYFGILAPLAVFLNILLVPLASLVIISGVFSLLFGFLHLAVISAFFNHGPLLLISFTKYLLDGAVKIPGAFLHMSWKQEAMGNLVAILFIASTLTAHGLKARMFWRFGIP
ncbi:MAG: ComEC/Rec2 family competence protein, partial [Verrucomicrobiae bacterium]|nr:ComEC/Rec2 family competence protein [Verrucomicrobiae bacterium]